MNIPAIATRIRGLLLLVLCLAAPAFGQVRSTLSQSRIAAGETVTLHIEVDDARSVPELAPLAPDFMVLRMDSGRQMEIRGTGIHTRQRFAVEMRPRRSGQIEIPALKVGTQYTQPMRLQVTDVGTPTDLPSQAQAGQSVFLETHLSDASPYVQQAVLVTVRLHYAVNLFSGELQQPAPANASLVPFGDDSRSSRVIDGREYRVLARHYLLLPERSGELVLPAAWFRGEGERMGNAGGWFGAARVQVEASTPAQRLDIRPIPAAAAAAWLPAHALSMRQMNAIAQGQVGQSLRLKLEVRADGAIAAQLPDPEIAPDSRFQIFAEPPERNEFVSHGRAQSVVTREFVLLPLVAGDVSVQAKPVDWWDVNARQARKATLAPIQLNIAAGNFQQQAAPLIVEARQVPEEVTDATAPARPRWLLWGLIGMAVLAALVWLTRRYPRQWRRTASEARSARRELQQALQAGDLPVIARLLPRVITPAAASLAELRARLVSLPQQQAIDALEQALWGGGNAEAARKQLRTAFAAGVNSPARRGKATQLLPPLYPEH